MGGEASNDPDEWEQVASGSRHFPIPPLNT